MTQNEQARTSRKTIDHNGNIVEKGYGAGRWAAVKRYDCKHGDCENAAVKLSNEVKTHNCCGEHDFTSDLRPE